MQLSKDPNSDKLKLATKKGVQVPNYYETFCFPIWYQLFCKLQQENHFKHCYVNSNILFVIAPKTRFNKYNIDKKKMLFSLQMLLSKQTFQILKMQLNHLNVTKHKMLLCAQTAIRLTCKRLAALLHPKNSLQNQMSFFFLPTLQYFLVTQRKIRGTKYKIKMQTIFSITNSQNKMLKNSFFFQQIVIDFIQIDIFFDIILHRDKNFSKFSLKLKTNQKQKDQFLIDNVIRFYGKFLKFVSNIQFFQQKYAILFIQYILYYVKQHLISFSKLLYMIQHFLASIIPCDSISQLWVILY
eukprot:TRINITY_DN631_c0_g1_i2.p1 TRINITY_DN631_c0_g1~~TRINITY_DN631_c0_g1_i2.p1  ORF type:complete len:297 (+),score=-16.16 TRINITY_DN631_c0_g1_i2:487-1377(+)